MEYHKTVEAYISNSGDAEEWLHLLREIVLSTGLKETVKWGAPVYTINNKNIVGLGAFKSYVGLWFYQGALLKDKKKKLINAQEEVTKAMRQWRFISIEEIKKETKNILEYIEEAKANQLAGKEIKPAKNKPLIIPDELKERFKKNPELKKSFDALNLTKRRDYAEYISTAKRAETKQSRLEKIIPMIMKGIGLNDKYK